MNNKDLQEIFYDITNYLSLESDKDKIFNFLRDLLSEKEIIEFSKRFEVANMLLQKTPYLKIEEKTKMSSTTIARVSKYLLWENKGYLEAINKLKSVSAKHHEGHSS